MAGISKVLETELNGLKVNLFEFDIENEENFNEIKAYLVNKVKISKVHNIEEYDLTYYGTKNLNPDFVARFNEQVAKINIPKKTKIPQFDVRRERVTEWMAQYLLEQEYGCKFYDEADKRVNLKTVEIDKHTDGIDVPGIWIDNDRIRFVVCEVKASEANQIPCDSVQSLQQDIQKAIDDVDNRVSHEILEYMHGIRNVKMQDDILEKIVDFLANLIAGEKEDLADNIMFFPFTSHPVLFYVIFSCCQTVNLRRNISGTISVINIYHRNSVCAGIDHRQKCRQSVHTCTISH